MRAAHKSGAPPLTRTKDGSRRRCRGKAHIGRSKEIHCHTSDLFRSSEITEGFNNGLCVCVCAPDWAFGEHVCKDTQKEATRICSWMNPRMHVPRDASAYGWMAAFNDGHVRERDSNPPCVDGDRKDQAMTRTIKDHPKGSETYTNTHTREKL